MIKKYQTKHGTRYMVKAYLGRDPLTGKEKRTTRRGFKTKQQARVVERRLLTANESDNTVTGPQTFRELVRVWRPVYQQTVKPQTFTTRISAVRQLVRQFGDAKLKAITPLALAGADLKPAQLQALRQVLGYAVKQGWLATNPAQSIRPVKSTHVKPRQFYTRGEFKQACALLQAYPFRNRYTGARASFAFYFLGMAGLRVGELSALEWSDYDGRGVTVDKTFASNINQLSNSPKTKHSNRYVTLDPATIECVEEWRQLQLAYFGELPQYLLANTHGKISGPNKVFDAIKHSDLAGHPLFQGFHAHILRHTHASLLFSAGVSPKAVQQRLGHASIKVTLDIYTHLTQATQADVADQLTAYLRGQKRGQ